MSGSGNGHVATPSAADTRIPNRLPIRLLLAGVVTALGIGGLLLIGTYPGAVVYASGPREEFSRIALLITSCYAAVLVQPDRRGFVAAITGATLALLVVVPPYLSHSPTTAGDASWTRLVTVVMLLYTVIILAAAHALRRILRWGASPERAQRRAFVVLAGMIAATILVMTVVPLQDAGPLPAPTAPTAPLN